MRNIPSFNVIVIRDDLPEAKLRRQVFERIGALLGMPPSGRPMMGRRRWRASSCRPTFPCWSRWSCSRCDEKTALIEQQQLTLPGVSIQVEARREYPFGELLGHILGYVGPVPAESVEEYRRWGYSPNDMVGQAGLEHTYESVLRGKKGEQRVEVNYEGRKTRVVGQPVEPEPGANLVLTIDTELQRVAAEALAEGMARKDSPAGVVVALDPRDGAIRALVSLPG